MKRNIDDEILKMSTLHKRERREGKPFMERKGGWCAMPDFAKGRKKICDPTRSASPRVLTMGVKRRTALWSRNHRFLGERKKG